MKFITLKVSEKDLEDLIASDPKDYAQKRYMLLESLEDDLNQELSNLITEHIYTVNFKDMKERRDKAREGLTGEKEDGTIQVQ